MVVVLEAPDSWNLDFEKVSTSDFVLNAGYEGFYAEYYDGRVA